ncbi:MAG: hypothetical protein MRY64_09115 [Hyphomonadaceae bacterium]|nr:hypothetical protein [Hyphomonadaceae bacterium]
MKSKLQFFAAASALFAVALSGCANTETGVDVVAQPAEQPADPAFGGLMPGTTLNWIDVDGGFDSGFMNVVVARGPDYTIFFDPEWAEYALDDEDPAAAYGVEYSGILYYGCDEALPGNDDREKIASLKEMSAGEVLELPDLGVSVKVGKESQSNINGLGDITVREYDIHWGGEEAAESELVSVAEEFDVTVKVVWSEGPPSVVAGVALTSAPKPLSLRHASALGNCAALVD